MDIAHPVGIGTVALENPYPRPRVQVSTGMGMGFAKNRGYAIRERVHSRSRLRNFAIAVKPAALTRGFLKPVPIPTL